MATPHTTPDRDKYDPVPTPPHFIYTCDRCRQSFSTMDRAAYRGFKMEHYCERCAAIYTDLRLTIRAEPEHLPAAPFSSEGLNQGVVNSAGEVVVTVWNHFGDENTLKLAKMITQIHEMVGLVGLVANGLGGNDQAMLDWAVRILREMDIQP